MAATIPLIDAVDYAQRYIKNVPLVPVMTKLINEVNQIIWMAAPWRWSVGSLPTFALAAATQDYTINYPADFLYAIDGTVIVATTTGGTGNMRDLRVVPVLPTAVGYEGQVNEISYPAAAAAVGGLVRVSPKPAQITGTQTVLGLYKKSPTLYTNATIQTATFAGGDEWFWVLQSGMLWKAYEYADDDRAGNASIQGDRVQFSGARGIFEANIEMMKQREPLILTDVFNKDTKEKTK